MGVSSGSGLATPALYHATKPTALASILGFHFTIPGRTGKAHSAPPANLGTIYRILRLVIKQPRTTARESPLLQLAHSHGDNQPLSPRAATLPNSPTCRARTSPPCAASGAATPGSIGARRPRWATFRTFSLAAKRKSCGEVSSPAVQNAAYQAHRATRAVPPADSL